MICLIMATIGSLVVRLSATTGKFQSDMRSAGRSVLNLAKKVPVLARVFSAAGLAGTLAMCTKLAKEQEDAEKKLAAVLRATGGAAGFSAKELRSFAAELQGLTNFGDEVTISAMAVLATFKGISGPAFKDAVRLVQDMSTVMGSDLKSSAILVGKALNDPIRGVSALTRVGVTLTTQQKELIRTLHEAGDVMGAQKVILAELKSEFGGAAEAMAEPMTQLKNSLGDIGEKLGEQILPHIRLLAKDLNEAANAADNLSSSFGWLGDAIGLVADEADFLSDMSKWVVAGFYSWDPIFKELIADFWELADSTSLLDRPFENLAQEAREVAEAAKEITDVRLEKALKAWADFSPSERAAHLATTMRELREAAAGKQVTAPAKPAALGGPLQKDMIEAWERFQDAYEPEVGSALQKDMTEAWEAFSEGAREAEATYKRLEDRAKSMALSVRTPFEELRDTLAEIQSLWRAGVLGAESGRRLVEQAGKQYGGTLPVRQQGARFAQVAEYGSAAAYEAIHGRAGPDPQEEIKRLTAIHVAEAKRLVLIGEEIRDNLAQPQVAALAP